ncbi:MAG: CHAT domain-containing tetratricopeptide repeat protein [Pseudomonadota bacterium]
MRNGTAVCSLPLLLLTFAHACADTLDEARTLHGNGELDAALEAYTEITNAPDQHSAKDRGTAHNNACVILLGKGAYSEARERCDAALTLRRDQRDNLRGLGRTLNNAGLVHQQLGEFALAAERYREALAINREREDWLAIAINSSNLGLLHTLAGDYGLAAARFDEAIAVADDHPDAPWSAQQRALARINQGVALEKLGAYREALSLFQLVRESAQLLDEGQRALLEVNLGVVYRNLGDPVAALRAFDEAKPLYDALDDRGGLANAWLNSGIVKHEDLANLEGALPDMQRALQIARDSGDRPEEITALLALGRLALSDGSGAAKGYFDLSLALARQTGSAEARWASLEGLARVALTEGDRAQALDHLREAIDIVESVGVGVRTAGVRSDFFGERRAVYELTVSVLASEYATAQDPALARLALNVARQAKARELSDALGRPELAGEAMTQQGVIEFFVAEERLYRWLIPDGADQPMQLHALDADPRALETQINAIYRALARGEQPDVAAAQALAAQLFQALPEAALDGEALYIAPDSFLYRVPFDLLPMASGSPLVETLALGILPSDRLLASAAAAPPVQTGAWAGFADPVIEAADAGPALARRRLAVTLDPLPAAAEELDRIARWVGPESSQHLGSAATEQAVLSALTDGTSVVHLATHAVLDERVGGTAAIVLSPEGDRDGLLTPEEIASVAVRSRLAVLSACRTAADLASEPRALESLTGAFLAGGAEAVVATLWDVEDTVSAAFMDQFYYQLGRGVGAGEALRQAKLALRSTPGWEHPTHWAAYVLVGRLDLDPLGAVRAGSRWSTPLALAALAAGLLALWLATRRRRVPASG